MLHSKFKICRLLLSVISFKISLNAIDNNVTQIPIKDITLRRIFNFAALTMYQLHDKNQTDAIDQAYPDLISSWHTGLRTLLNLQEQFDLLVITSFNDPTNPFYKLLIERIVPMLFTNDLKKIDTQDPNWLFFFQFLEYYKPETENYNKLSNDSKEKIQHLRTSYESLLKSYEY